MASAAISYGSPLLEIPADATTFDGFRNWATSDEFPQGYRITFINGELLIDMSPEDLSQHIEIKSTFSGVLYRLCRKTNIGRFFPDGTLVSNKRAGLSAEPDATVVKWDTFKSGKVRLVPRKTRPNEISDLSGTPDMVLEIVSWSSVVKDNQTLRDSYHKAGIGEYWLVNPLGENPDFQILKHAKTGYVAVLPERGWVRSPLFGCSFRLTRKRDPVGQWQYTLRVRAK